GVAVKSTKQKNVAGLLAEQSPFDERALNDAFVQMAGALPCRPAPRHVFDNVAVGRLPFKGRDALLAADAVLRDAVATGDVAIVEQSAARITAFFRQLEAAALTRYYAIVNGAVSFKDATLAASKETGEALHLMMCSALSGADAPHDEAIREIDEAIEALS